MGGGSVMGGVLGWLSGLVEKLVCVVMFVVSWVEGVWILSGKGFGGIGMLCLLLKCIVFWLVGGGGCL